MIHILVALKEEFKPSEELLKVGINVVYTGVGCTSALLALVENSKQFNTNDLVINIGSAGSHGKNVGKLFYSNHFSKSCYTEKLPLKAYLDTCTTIVPTKLEQLFDTTQFIQTNDSFVEHMSDEHILYDMESYAEARFFTTQGINFFAIKYITDSGNHMDWVSSLVQCNQKLKEELLKCIKLYNK